MVVIFRKDVGELNFIVFDDGIKYMYDYDNIYNVFNFSI